MPSSPQRHVQEQCRPCATRPRQCRCFCSGLLLLLWRLSATDAFVLQQSSAPLRFLTASSCLVRPSVSSIGLTLSGENYNLNPEPTSSLPPIGLYIHIPYCRRRCRYCDFAIVPVGNTTPTTTHSHSMDEDSNKKDGFLKLDDMYRQAILQELALIRSSTEKDTIIPLQSVYLGGGTPSLAPIETLQSILKAATTFPFVLQPDAEITMEMDPNTFKLSQLQTLVQTQEQHEGRVNRISFGVQSFDNAILESLGRVHREEDIVESLRMIQRVVDVQNEDKDHKPARNIQYSMDLISGLPGVSLARWADTLERATMAIPPPSHLSLYDLQIEQGTVFGRWYDEEHVEHVERSDTLSLRKNNARSPLPPAEDCAFMYKYAAGYLRSKGYEHYEISSYAKVDPNDDRQKAKSRRSRHNQIYWTPEGQWYAVGLGATSSVRGHRFARPRRMKDYIDWVEAQTKISPAVAWLPDEHDSIPDDHTKVDMDFLTDVIMTRLRTSDGLDLSWADQYVLGGSKAVLEGASLGLELGLAECVQDKDGHNKCLRLVDPDGFLFSNTIISSIFFELGLVGAE